MTMAAIEGLALFAGTFGAARGLWDGATRTGCSQPFSSVLCREHAHKNVKPEPCTVELPNRSTACAGTFFGCDILRLSRC